MMKQLGEICDIQLGKMLSQKSRTGVGTAPYLRNQNVQWGRFDLGSIASMDFSPREREKFSLLPGDLIVCEGGEPGRAAVWQGDLTECYFQKALFRLRPRNGGADPYFLLYRLQLGALLGEFSDSNAKTTIAHLPAVRLSKINIHLPDLQTQRRIALQLNEQMAVVEAARKAVEAQREGLNALISAEIRVGISQPETRIRLVGDVMEEVSQGVGSAWADFPVLGATRNGIAAAKEPVGKNPQRYKPVIPGTVFYNPMRIMIGSIAMLDEGDGAGITSPDYVALRPRDGSVRSLWFYCWLRSAFGAAFISSLARGAVRERMLFSRLREGEMPVPPDHWQSHFQGLARHIRKAIAVLDEQAEAIEKLPAAYLRAAFGGIE